MTTRIVLYVFRMVNGVVLIEKLSNSIFFSRKSDSSFFFENE